MPTTRLASDVSSMVGRARPWSASLRPYADAIDSILAEVDCVSRREVTKWLYAALTLPPNLSSRRCSSDDRIIFLSTCQHITQHSCGARAYSPAFTAALKIEPGRTA